MGMPSVPAQRADEATWPALPLEAWEDSKKTLHRFAQIVGKIRLATAPRQNHWWHVPLYVSARGLTTGPMPWPGEQETFAVDFDFINHRLVITTSTGAASDIALRDGLSVALFHKQLFEQLRSLDIHVNILARPFDLTPVIPFADDETHASYDQEYVHRFWRILLQVDMVFKEFAGRFVGKSSPVHLFWHSFDLAVTRFSGRRAPNRPDADHVTREAYSHEVISVGFWAGDDKVRAPAFYAYAAPEPPGLADHPLAPTAARWTGDESSSMALLMYDDACRLPSPHTGILEFLNSAYAAGARTGGWTID